MPANSPEEVHQLFAAAFAEASLDALMALYEPNATLAPAPGTWVSGQAAIREALSGFLQQKPEFKMKVGKVIQSGDIALLISSWVMKVKDEKGETVELTGQTTDVVRKQGDGSWKTVIDNPWGVAEAAG
jgi:uncharacterized protein (TIGR02246 family)